MFQNSIKNKKHAKNVKDYWIKLGRGDTKVLFPVQHLIFHIDAHKDYLRILRIWSFNAKFHFALSL